MMRTKKMLQCAIFLSLALVLSYFERFIPLQMLIPLPGVKLGLANIVTLSVMYLMGWKFSAAILVLRCFMGAMFSGGVTALAFSLTGGCFALAAMLAARRIPIFSVYGVSILGAAAHNVGQICAAMAFMNSLYIAGYLPYLLTVSLFTGFATGGACAGVLRILGNIKTAGRL